MGIGTHYKNTYQSNFGNAFEDRNKWYGELSDSMVRLIIERS